MSGIITFARNGAALRHIVGAVGLAGMLLFGRVAVEPPVVAQESDMDGDATLDGVEVAAGTDPWHAPAAGQEADSDGDGLLDEEEAYVLHTNPVEADSDADGIRDGEEIALGLDPLTANVPDAVGPSPSVIDGDGDGLSDFDETNIWGTDPHNDDTGNDFLNDGFEASQVGLNPLNPDSDFDGMSDSCDDDPTVPSSSAEQRGCTTQF